MTQLRVRFGGQVGELGTARSLPPRPSVAAHVEGILRQGLAEGRWAEGLPGERQLAVQLGVSRPTLRKAISALRRKGMLKVAHGRASKPTRRAQRIAVVPESKTVIALVPEPMHRLPSLAVFTFDQLRSNLAEAGLRLEVRAVGSRRRELSVALQAMLEGQRPAVWLLYQQDRAVHRWFHERALPCVVFGTQDRAFPLPAVDLDQRATSRHAAQFLLRCGYPPAKIALLVPNRRLPGHGQMSAGLRDALGAKSRTFEVPSGPAQLLPALDRVLAEVGRPAAFIFARAPQAVAALGHFGIRRRLRLPEDVALICLNDDPLFRHLQPPMAHYQRDEAAIASQLSALVVRAATESGARPRMTMLIPEFIRGETVPAGAATG